MVSVGSPLLALTRLTLLTPLTPFVRMKKEIFLGLVLLPLLALGGCNKTSINEVTKGGGAMVAEKIDLTGRRILMVVAPRDFRDEEFFEPKKIFEDAGATVTVSSQGVLEATGLLGGKVRIDKDLAEVRASDYDAVVFVGGGGATIYFDDPLALNLAKTAFTANKVVAGICIAPTILAKADVLRGKRATAFSSEKETLEADGAVYTGEAVTVDGKIITARGPEAAKEFGQKIVETLR
jgi:protease I